MVIFLGVVAAFLVAMALVDLACVLWHESHEQRPDLSGLQRAFVVGAVTVVAAVLGIAPAWLSAWVVRGAVHALGFNLGLHLTPREELLQQSESESEAPAHTHTACRFLGTRASCSCCSLEHFSC